MSYTKTLAEFACSTGPDDIPASALAAGKFLIKDTVACAVAGYGLPSSEIVETVVGGFGGRPESTVLVSGRRLPAASVAYINSHLGNAIDADDTLHYKAHIAAATVAPAMAMAEREGSPGRDLLAAVVVGYDVAARIAMSLRSLVIAANGSLQFAPVSGYSCVAFASTVCAGRLVGLNPEQMRNAFGITAASAPLPSSSQFGLQLPRPMTKYAMYGTLGQVGVTSALLAKEGFTGERSVLDGEKGFWKVVGSVDCNWNALTDRLGERWSVEEVIYKAYPGCRFLSAAIDLFYDMRRRHGFHPDDVDRIEVGVHSAALSKHMDDPAVETMVDACFSLPYLLSAAAYAGPPGPNWHTVEARTNRSMRAFAEKVRVDLEPTAATAAAEDLKAFGHNTRMPCTIKIQVNGMTFGAEADYAHGDPYSLETAFTEDDLNKKFHNFCARHFDKHQIENARIVLSRLEKEPSVTAVLSNLVAGVDV